ncbi:hypothetical protein MAM1_0167d07064 [Mucor ambiguus]|uniref:Uncharacterized protein n=1 Tax=Mucor ambiguus TaxID=91626 RepID=A0A0C9MJH4_9FUNG|nr:hypothetical protein MAM1_0167d07064 [Mucor ambiguus]
MSEPGNQAYKPKKRSLTSRTRSIKSGMIEMPQDKPQSTPLKRRKRKLNTPATDKPLLTKRTSSTSPPPNTPIPLATITTVSSQPAAPPKRSLRAASQAIAKREKERLIHEAKAPSPPPKAIETSPEKAPVIKKKRKLHTQKVLIPKTSSSQEYEEIGDDSYDKYLDNNSPTPITTTPTRVSARRNPLIVRNIPSTVEPEPAIVIGVPTRKRKLGRTTSTFAARSTARKMETADDTTTEPEEETTRVKSLILDLSQHTIIPNESYVAHLPQSSSSRRRRSTTTESASTVVSSSIESVTSQSNCDPAPASSPDAMYTMDSYTTKSSPTIFYDAISDFEDMNIDDSSLADEDAMMMSDVKEDISSQQSSGSFWGSILKPFK